MTKKILITLTVLILIILPFLLAIPVSRYSPYIETNSIRTYVIISTAISVAAAAVVLLLLKRFYQPSQKIPVGGALLFLLLCPLTGIFGLASAPDLSLKMLEHPEREHLRYTFLFTALILFGGFILLLYKSGLSQIKKSAKWIITVILAVAFAEYTWEFSHHYLYPEGLKDWVSQGKDAADFDKNYDNIIILNIGAAGRYFQFAAVVWLSYHFYKLRRIKIWCPIINTIFSLLGIASAAVASVHGFPFPKRFEFLMLFFIPGIPFFLLYWLGVALLTKFKKSEAAA